MELEKKVLTGTVPATLPCSARELKYLVPQTIPASARLLNTFGAPVKAVPDTRASEVRLPSL